MVNECVVYMIINFKNLRTIIGVELDKSLNPTDLLNSPVLTLEQTV